MNILFHASFISSALVFLLSLSLPFPEFCFAAAGKIARPISAARVGKVEDVRLLLACSLRLARLALLSTSLSCSSYLSQANPGGAITWNLLDVG